MAKRNETTGGPKKRVRTQEDLDRRASYLSKAQRSARNERILLIMIGTAVVTIALIIIGALLYDQAYLPTTALTTVGDQEISITDFQDRVKYERFALAEQVRAFYNNARTLGNLSEDDASQQTLAIFAGQQGQGTIDYLTVNEEAFAQQVLQKMEDELVIEAKAKELGITSQVDEAAVQAEIDRYASLITGESLEATPSSTPSLEPSLTVTPLVSDTPSSTPTETLPPTETIQPTALGCAEGDTNCATVTPLPTNIPSLTPTNTPEMTDTPTPTHTPISQDDSRATVVAYRGDYLDRGKDESSLSDDAIRKVFYYDALRKDLTDYITSQQEGEFADYYVNPQDIWVNSRHILIQFPEGEAVPEGDDNAYFAEAKAIADAIRAGEPFASVAMAESDDQGSGANGGDLGWSSSTGYVEGFKEAIETLPLGEISEPVRSQFGYHIIQVLDRETREFDEQQLQSLRDQSFSEWLSSEGVLVSRTRRESWQDFIPNRPDYNDLLDDILPDYDPVNGFSDE